MKTWLQLHFHWLWRVGLLTLVGLAAIVLVTVPMISNLQKQPVRFIAIGKSPSADVAFWRSVEQGLKAAGLEFNATVEYRAPLDESHVDDQISLVNQAIAEKPAAIILAAIDKYRLVAPARAARAAGIQVIMVDSSIAGDPQPIQKCFVATDNVAAGEKLGNLMTSLLPTGQKLLLVSPSTKGDSLNGRETGVRKVIGDKYAILPTIEVQGGVTMVYAQVSQALAEHPDVSGIVCLNETTTAGAARAVRGAGLTGKVRLLGFDSSEELVNYLEEGLLTAVVIQRPFNMGYLSVVHALDVIAGRPVEPFYDTGSIVVTKNTLYQEEIEKLVFPFE